MAESRTPRAAVEALGAASRIAPHRELPLATVSAPEWLIRFTHAWFDRLAAFVLPIFYPRIIVHDASRFPSRGAVLAFSNHPSTWADGVLMTVALGRPMRFLVHAPLYHPRVRGWLLSSYGALPLYHRDDTPAAIAKNEDTSCACHAALERGQAVMTFPEGVSSTDWRMRPFKSGTARIALGYAADGRPGHALTLIPVGIYYRDRTAFRSVVEISVGEPIRIVRAAIGADALRVQVESLTKRMFDSMAGLVVHAADPETESLAKALLPIVHPEWRNARAAPEAARQPASTLASARQLVGVLERWQIDAPDRRAELEVRVRRYREARDRVGLNDDQLSRPAHASPAVKQVAWLLLALGVAPLALAGWVLHWLPAGLTRLAVWRYAGEPSRVGFGRVVAGFALFPAVYATGGLLLWRVGTLPAAQVVLLLAGSASLGFIALSSRNWISRNLRDVRLGWLEWQAPDRVACARQARAAVIDLLAAERPESASAPAGGAVPAARVGSAT